MKSLTPMQRALLDAECVLEEITLVAPRHRETEAQVFAYRRVFDAIAADRPELLIEWAQEHVDILLARRARQAARTRFI